MNISTLAAEGLRKGCFITFCHQSAGKFQKSTISDVMTVIYDIKPTTNWTDRTNKKWYQI